MLPRRPTLSLLAAVVIQALAWSTSHAAAGFITSSNISTGDVYTEITIRLGCDVTYLGHLPAAKGDALSIDLETTSICHGVPPSLADSREIHRPLGADEVGLVHVEYDGERPEQKQLRLSFAGEVHFLVTPSNISETVVVRVLNNTGPAATTPTSSGATGRRVNRVKATPARFVINLESSLRYPAAADIPVMTLAEGQKLFITEAEIEGKTWYRNHFRPGLGAHPQGDGCTTAKTHAVPGSFSHPGRQGLG